MPLLPDSGEPGNLHVALGTAQTKPELLTEATWQHISERFQLRGERGRGAQAVVFEAKEKNAPHRRIALKVYHENTDEARRAFDNECRILASDRLPSEVVGYYQCVAADDVQPYLVLEFIDGRKLADLATQPRALSLLQKVELIEALARAFHRLHSCNLVFGDASANNILVEKDNVIRFVDLAGAKELIKGHGRSRSSINLVTPGFFAQTNADNAAMKEVRTNLNTDIYALSANAFLLLVGRTEDQCRNGSSRDAALEWNRALIQAGVTNRRLRRIVLKGLRVPDDGVSVDPKLYATAEDFANDLMEWRARQIRVQALIRHSFVAALLLVSLGLVAFHYWEKWITAEAAADLKVWQSLQGEIRELPNLTHPAVNKRIEDEKRLIAERDDLIARDDSSGARGKLLEMLASSRETLKLAREIDRAARLREAIGKVLLDEPRRVDFATTPAGEPGGVSPRTDDTANVRGLTPSGSPNAISSGFWVTAAPVIDRRLDELQRMYQDLAKRIAAGDVERLSDDLGILQERLVELFNTNLEARAAFDARVGYELLQRTVPERLRSQDGFVTIQAAARRAETAWAVTDWDQGRSLALAKLQFGSAKQELAEWLEKNETVAEKSAREKDNQQRVQQLEAERQKLIADFNAKVEEVRKLNESIAAVTQERLDDQKKLAAATTALTAEKKLRSDAEAKVAEFDRMKTALAKVESDLKAEKAKTAELGDQKRTAELNLTATRSQMKAEKDRADRAEEQVKQLVAVANSGSADAAKRAKEIAELNSKIAAVDTSDLKQADEAFAAAKQRYDTLDAERWQLLTKYKANAPTVKTKDAELAVAAQQLEAALGKLDAAHQQLFAQYDERLAKQQAKLKKLTDDEGLLDTAAEVVAVRAEIKNLQQQQQLFAAGAARAAGTGKKLTLTEILTLAGGVVNTANAKAGERLVLTIDGIHYAFRYCPPGKFKMGTPTSESGHQEDEAQVDVTLTKSFWMLETEVTQGMYQAVTKQRPWQGREYVKEGASYPAAVVSWNDATDFCQKLTTLAQREGKLPADEKFALPTEAQWEYAARAGTTTAYFFGNDATKLGEYAWYDQNAWDIGEKYAHQVGQKKPNPWGLLDMTGNVWEWCGDWYGNRLPGGTDPRGSTAGSYRVLRGGSFFSDATVARVGNRVNSDPPSFDDLVGFRVVRVSE